MEPKGSKAMTWLFMTFLTESQVTSLSMVSPIFFQEMTSRFICLETALSHFAAAVEAGVFMRRQDSRRSSQRSEHQMA